MEFKPYDMHVPVTNNVSNLKQTCSVDGCVFWMSHSFRKHIARDHVRKTFQCWVCGENMVSDVIKNHMEVEHPDYICPSDTGNVQCCLCDVLVPEHIFESHASVHIKLATGKRVLFRYQCITCYEVYFDDIPAGQKHYRSKHCQKPTQDLCLRKSSKKEHRNEKSRTHFSATGITQVIDLNKLLKR